ncbi:MAG: hypothetical protein NVV83_04565 [Afipia sp.]|nr:hypothetical protein [Afipia sp.]
MRKLDRASVAVPPSLSGPSAAVVTEINNAAAYYSARTPWQASHIAYVFEKYRSADVKAALRQLSGGNCAYCESKIGAVGAREVEHYRPKGGIRGEAQHPGYWWLAHSWNNLLPTCRDCNKSLRQHIVTPGMSRAEVEALLGKRPSNSHGKANQFDIQGTRALGANCNLDDEDPLLINPCERNPANELSWDFSAELTLIEPRRTAAGFSPFGAYTIRTCALNRAEIVLDRIPALRPMRALRTHILNRLNRWNGNADELSDILAEVTTLKEFAEPDQPYAGMAAAYIIEFEMEFSRWRVARGLTP